MAIKQTKTPLAANEMRWPFGKRNYIFMALALVVIILGYVSLGMGSITLAPLLLVIGYCVLIPVALIIKDPSVEAGRQSGDESAAQ
jgi:uncharacterized membrane protein HdeD (DUF308 family)